MARLRLLPDVDVEEELKPTLFNMPAKENIEMWRREAEEERKKTPKQRFDELYPDRPKVIEKTKSIQDRFIDALLEHEGLVPFQTPARGTYKDTYLGFPIKKDYKKPKGREAFIFLEKQEDVPKSTKEQIKRYPGGFLPEGATLRDAIYKYDAQNPEGKERYIKQHVPEIDLDAPISEFFKESRLRLLPSKEEEKQHPFIPKSLLVALGATVVSPIPGDELVVAAAILGVGAYGTWQFIKKGGPQAVTDLVNEAKTKVPQFVERLRTLSSDLKRRILEGEDVKKFVPADLPTGIPPYGEVPEVLKPKPEELPAEVPKTREEAMLVHKIYQRGGYVVPPTIDPKTGKIYPGGISTIPPFIPKPTEEEIRGREAGREIYPAAIPKTPEEMILKAEGMVRKGRIEYLDTEARRISNEMTSLEKARAQLVTKGAPTGEIDRKLQQLSRQFNYVDSQIAEVITEDVAPEELAKVKATIKIGDLVKAEAREERRVLRAEERVEALRERQKDVAIRKRVRRENSAYVRKMLTDVKEVDVRHMRPEFTDIANQIKSNLDFAVPTKKTLGKLWSRKEYLEEYPEANLPDYALEELERLEKINRDDLTIEQLENLHMTVLHAAHLSKYKNELLFRRVAKDANAAIEEAVDNVLKRKVRTTEQEYDIDVTKEEPRIGLLRQIFTVKSVNAELNAEILDKEEYGIIKKLLFDNIDEGVTNGLRYHYDIKDKWSDFIVTSEIDTTGWSNYFDKKARVDWQTLTLPSGKTIKMSKANRVEFYMHTLNEKNNAHLMEGGYAFERNPTEINKLTEEDKRAIINSMTEDEKVIANAFKEIVYDPQHAALNEPYLAINGYPLGREENYLRIRVAGISLPKEIKGLHKKISQAALEEMGMLKERKDAKNPIIIGDIFKTTYESIRNATTFIGLAVPIRDAKMLLYSQRFETTLRQTYGRAWHQYFDTYLEDVVGSMVRMDDVERLVLTAKDRLVIALLGLNPFIWLYQPTSYLGASTEIDSKYLIVNAKTIATKELLEKWMSRSPQLRQRIEGGYSRDVAEVGRIGAIREFWTGRKGMADKLMGGIKNFDTKTIIRLAEACEMEQAELGYKGEDLALRATARAEEVIRKTQPTFHAKDRSEISRSRRPLVRMLTLFMSQRNKNFIMQRRGIEKYGRSPKRPGDKAKLIWALLITSVIQHNVIQMWRRLRRRIVRPKKEIKPEKGTTIFVRDWLGGVFGNFYGGAQFANSLASKIERGTWAGYDMRTPLAALMEAGVDAIAETTRAIQQFIANDIYKSGRHRHEKKWKYSLLRGVDKASQVELTRRGIPYMTIKAIMQAGWKWFVNPDTEKVTKSSGLRLLR